MQVPEIPSAVFKSPQPFVPGVLSSASLLCCVILNKVFLASLNVCVMHVLL